MKPVISVIVPIGGNLNYLEECLDSITAQTLVDIEVICVFDGTSKAGDVVMADQRISCITISECGPGAARNAGIDRATGTYIAFCDADDILPYKALECSYQKMAISRADVVMGSFIEQFDSGNSVRCSVSNQGNGFDRFFAYISIWNRLYRRDFLAAHSISFAPRMQGEDLLFLGDVFLAKPRVATINKIVYQWQRHEMDKIPTLTHTDCLTDYLELLTSWKDFLERMEDRYFEESRSHGRAACPYLLDRLGNIVGTKDQEVAYWHLIDLVKMMEWEKYPIRFKKLFLTRPEKLLSGSPSCPTLKRQLELSQPRRMVWRRSGPTVIIDTGTPASSSRRLI